VHAGYTFDEVHDAFVGMATNAGLPDWMVNIQSMIPMYMVAQYLELLRSVGIVEQPSPTNDMRKCE
jgi:hypothetical protein